MKNYNNYNSDYIADLKMSRAQIGYAFATFYSVVGKSIYFSQHQLEQYITMLAEFVDVNTRFGLKLQETNKIIRTDNADIKEIASEIIFSYAKNHNFNNFFGKNGLETMKDEYLKMPNEQKEICSRLAKLYVGQKFIETKQIDRTFESMVENLKEEKLDEPAEKINEA